MRLLAPYTRIVVVVKYTYRTRHDTVCRHCGKVVKNKGGNTSNLLVNLKTKQFYRVKKYRYYRYFLYIDVGFFQYRNNLRLS